MEDLVLESIKMYGMDIWYLPRGSASTQDRIYGEDPTSVFESAYEIEIYLSNVQSFEGQSEYFSKFDMEVRDSARVIMARRAFQKYVPADTAQRPREGDLIYIPMMNNLFEIKFVEEDKDFYSLGRRPPFFYYYELKLELFKFSQEKFRTGIEEIDQVGSDYAYTIRLNLDHGAGVFRLGENVYQGLVTAPSARAQVKAWNAPTRALDIIHVYGTFDAASGNVVGQSSSASYPITTLDTQSFDQVLEELADNSEVQEEANNVIDFSETNPFGTM
jgi:hypothetical protein